MNNPGPISLPHAWSALDHAAAVWPDQTALVFARQQQQLSFLQWRERALQLAAGLYQAGLRSGDHIAVLAENRIEWPVVQLAVAALGGVFLPLNTHYQTDDLQAALATGDVKAVIASELFRSHRYLHIIHRLQPRLPGLEHVWSIDQLPLVDDTQLTAQIAAEDTVQRCADAASALLYTSGTTGLPKGAMLSQRAMMLNAAATVERMALQPGDRWTSIIPLFHCAGCIMNILGCLQSGAAYVGVESFSPGLMFEIIEQQRCTHLSGVPTSWLAMLQYPQRSRHDLSTLRGGTCGGADADPAMLEQCATEFPAPELVQVYGQTESATLVSCPAKDDPHRLVTAGPALAGYRISIVDPVSGAECRRGDTGEIRVTGPMIMQGYYNNPAATAETITADGWLRTGDLGYMTEHDRLVIAGGRLRDMIIRGGENIYPVEIEHQLATIAGVIESAVFGLPDSYYGEIVAAAVRLDGDVTVDQLCRHCSTRIAGFKVPVKWYQVDQFPLTPSGKIRKIELREMAQSGALEILT